MMFEGKIRPCLKCGKQPEHGYLSESETIFECVCRCSFGTLGPVDKNYFRAITRWNIMHTPPEELLKIKFKLSVHGMELPT